MKVALSTVGKFHTFDLARELLAEQSLAGVLTGYPRFKLRHEGIPNALLKTFPWLMGPYMAFPWRQRMSPRLVQEWENLIALTSGRWNAFSLPPCDVYVGLSGTALPAGLRQQRRGGRFVCDRGSSHIRTQDELMREEHQRWGMPYQGIDPRTVAREEAEYEHADAITVPSQFVLQSFLERGVSQDKLKLLPYGVNLQRFKPVEAPNPERMDVLFVGGMGLRKGVQYLVQAYKALQHPAKSLTFVGAPAPELIARLQALGHWPDDARVLGHMPQSELKQIMSRSHVLVLPSIEEGLAMVMAQAMACGCPVIASRNTGASDLFTDGEQGFIVPIRDEMTLARCIQRLADEPGLRDRMGKSALERVQHTGGWREYGQQAMGIYQDLIRP